MILDLGIAVVKRYVYVELGFKKPLVVCCASRKETNARLIEFFESMNAGIKPYNESLAAVDKEICDLLATTIDSVLTEAESKIWHAHPVWFLEGNPIVGYSKQKKGMRLMFWSGADFEEEDLAVRGEKFKDASIFYNSAEEIDVTKLQQWLGKSRETQWDYKNIVKRKGKLERLR